MDNETRLQEEEREKNHDIVLSNFSRQSSMNRIRNTSDFGATGRMFHSHAKRTSLDFFNKNEFLVKTTPQLLSQDVVTNIHTRGKLARG